MNNLQPHFHLPCSWEEQRPKEPGEMPTHLFTKWNNREDSEQQWSSNLFYLGDKWDKKHHEDKERRKTLHMLTVRSVFHVFETLHFLPQRKQALRWVCTSKLSQILPKGSPGSRKGACSHWPGTLACRPSCCATRTQEAENNIDSSRLLH